MAVIQLFSGRGTQSVLRDSGTNALVDFVQFNYLRDSLLANMNTRFECDQSTDADRGGTVLAGILFESLCAALLRKLASLPPPCRTFMIFTSHALEESVLIWSRVTRYTCSEVALDENAGGVCEILRP